MLKLSNGALLDPNAIICVLQQSNVTKVYLRGDEWLAFTIADGDIIRRYFDEHPRHLNQAREEETEE